MMACMPDDPIVQLHQVAKRFPGRPPVQALRDISAAIPAGSVTALLGANGAGKSTLLRLLAGTLKPERGRVVLFGAVMPAERPRIRNRLGFLLGSSTGLYGRLTAREQLRYVGRLRGMRDATIESRISRLADELELRSFLDRACGGFSTGMRQRTAIAATILHEPELIILDEPFAGLDMAVRREVAGIIRQIAATGASLLVATHQPAELESLATDLWILAEGTTRVRAETGSRGLAAALLEAEREGRV